ncbi:DNA replication licensing factor mcm10 [Hyphodiscus hymeniophilus]|uniref:DNA replication licensing factor mcm10 n=1 Tax=Hyphodiscus hymeniophilus TaxID=353542 RepID=A0A9P7AYA0_9HELO|nr:DNA replication licensing factor mcm10 [Hyphodiscus hymeniophilus]
MDIADEDDEDDDEETLQLQLQEIQARLKLKKLQKKAAQTSDTEKEINRAGSTPLPRANSVVASRAQSRRSGLREERLHKSKSQNSIHVPVSPVKRTQASNLPRSPQRVLLGIDKGLKGSDISLKRAPSFRKDDASQKTNLLGPFLQRTASQASSRVPGHTSVQDDRPLSFSERMAAMKKQDKDSQERDLRIKKNRSMAFDVDHAKMQNLKDTAVEYPDARPKAPEFSRDEVLQSFSKPSGSLPRNTPTPGLQSAMRKTSNSTATATASAESVLTKAGNIPIPRVARLQKKPGELTDAEASQFEPYSSLHLSRRIIPHKDLARTLTSKKPFVIPDLLRTVKGPDFSGPDVEEDVVVFAIVAQKSEPRAHAQNGKNDKRGKYMVMGLTDLKWELDLFLFDSAFEKLWKLTVGTIIAILNPGFMPPPRGRADTGKFSLSLNSNSEAVLEIGTARDLGFCKSVKKDGKTCTAWVDRRHTEFCDFHVNETLKKTHASRMEVNTMNFGFRANGEKKHNTRDMTGHYKRQKEAEEAKRTRYDAESHSQIFISKRSAASLLDDADYDPDAFHRGSTKEERMNRRVLEKEKERELERKLAGMGSGAGADYARKRVTSPSSSQQVDLSGSNQDAEPPPDAAALGLLDGKASDVQLSPIKRKRAHTTLSSAAVGWGGNLSKELGRMKDGESLQPIKKKTRFVTERGIREAGRESIGGDAVKAAASTLLNDDNDDDDDLEITKD